MKKGLLLLIALLGFSQLYADEYIPLVREGVKWVCLETKYIESAELYEVKKRFYTIEFKGDSVIDGITYKKCYRYSDNEWVDDGYIIPCSKTEPFAMLREENRIIYVYATDYRIFEYSYSGFRYWSLDDWYASGQKEVKLYELKETNHFKLSGYKQFLNQESEIYYFNDFENILWDEGAFIEGVGFDSDVYGDLLTPFWEGAYSLNVIYSYIGLHHMEDADGNIIYKGAAYTESATGNIDGDLNGDGIIDVEDVNILINKILKLE